MKKMKIMILVGFILLSNVLYIQALSYATRYRPGQMTKVTPPLRKPPTQQVPLQKPTIINLGQSITTEGGASVASPGELVEVPEIRTYSPFTQGTQQAVNIDQTSPPTWIDRFKSWLKSKMYQPKASVTVSDENIGEKALLSPEQEKSPGRLISRREFKKTKLSAPFPFGGQRREYSTASYAAGGNQEPVPSSFEPSFMSKIPGTKQNKIEELFKEFYDGLEFRWVDREHSNHEKAHLPWESQVKEFESLVKQTGYNPLNRNFEGKPSFFAKMLNLFAQEKISEYGYIGDFDIPSRFYKLGARWRPEEENQLFFKQQNYTKFLHEKGSQLNTFSFAKDTLNDVLKYIEFIGRWKLFFKRIGLNINDIIPEISNINWDYVHSFTENCGYLVNKNILDIKIEELLKRPRENIFMLIRFILYGVIAHNIEDLIGIAQKAGFFRSARSYEKSDSGSNNEQPENSEEIEKKFKTKLGLSLTASDDEVKTALTKYRKLNHPDLTPHDLSPEERAKEKKRRDDKLKEINDLYDKYLEKK